MSTAAAYLGIDVQTRRGCCAAVVDRSRRNVLNRWFDHGPDLVTRIRQFAQDTAERLGEPVAVGIDAPRMMRPEPRRWYWNGKTQCWRPSTPADRGAGRHCEVVVSGLGLARPQWTPVRGGAPEWMRLGEQLFDALEKPGPVYEVFPTASYRMLDGDSALEMPITTAGFRRGPKDMLDAVMAAVTVCEFDQGRGDAVGGGDGLGVIVLPRPVTDAPAALLQWPDHEPSESSPCRPCPSPSSRASSCSSRHRRPGSRRTVRS